MKHNKKSEVVGSTMLEIIKLFLALLLVIPIIMIFVFSFRMALGFPDIKSQNTINRLVVAANSVNSGSFYLFNTLSPNTVIISVPEGETTISKSYTCYSDTTTQTTQKINFILLQSNPITLPCPKGRSCFCLIKIQKEINKGSQSVTVDKVYDCKTINHRISSQFCIYHAKNDNNIGLIKLEYNQGNLEIVK